MSGRILFIDDDKAGREVALFNLRKAGYEVTVAGTGGLVPEREEFRPCRWRASHGNR